MCQVCVTLYIAITITISEFTFVTGSKFILDLGLWKFCYIRSGGYGLHIDVLLLFLFFHFMLLFLFSIWQLLTCVNIGTKIS